MHGPIGAYAINGHSRNYYAIDASDPNRRKYVGGFSIYCETIFGTLSGATIEVTRNQAATVLRCWRQQGLVIYLTMDHTKFSGAHCTWCDMQKAGR
jgi:hypothetical protein